MDGGLYPVGISLFGSTSAATAPMPSVQQDQIWGQTLVISWFPMGGLENRRLSNTKGGGSRGQRPQGKDKTTCNNNRETQNSRQEYA